MKKMKSERGQVLILVILAIVGLFGFAALAVDGGRFFSERRRAQNASDAAAFSAAYAGAKSEDWQAAGIASTQLNGYADIDPNQNAGAPLDVRVHHPPVRGRYTGNNDYYQVIIRTQVEKIFSQFVYNGDLWLEVETVTRATAQGGFPHGAAIVATCSNCCDALRFRGTGDIVIDGGSALSNSLETGNPTDQDACHSTARWGSAAISINGGSLTSAGSLYHRENQNCRDDDHNIIPCLEADGGIQTNTGTSQSYLFPHVPTCAGLPTVNQSTFNSTQTISPGIYTNGITASGNNTVLTLNSGLYCLDGDLNIPSASIVGSNVMFYMRSGDVLITTNNPVTLSAPAGAFSIPDEDVQPGWRWSGFLIYMPYDNPGIVYLAGGGSTSYSGTVYAPGPLSPIPYSVPGHGSDFSHKCLIQGSQVETAMNASIICYTVDVAGTNLLNITYDDSLNAQSPGSIELTE